jgi:HYR domain
MPLAWRRRILGLGIAVAAALIPIAASAGTDFIGGTCGAILSPVCVGAIAEDSFTAGPAVDSLAGGQTLAGTRYWSWSISNNVPRNLDAATISVQSNLNLSDQTQFAFNATTGPFPGTPVPCTITSSSASCTDSSPLDTIGGLLVTTFGQTFGAQPTVGVPIQARPGFDSSRTVTSSGVTAQVTITDAARFAPGATRIRIRLDAGLLTVTAGGTALSPCSFDSGWAPGPACTDGPSFGGVNVLRAQPATTYQITGPGDPSLNALAPELDVSVISYTCGSAFCQPPYAVTANSLTYTDPQIQGSVTFSAAEASSFRFDQEQASVVQFPAVYDMSPPVISVPAPITVNATSPAGAAVNYVVSATDPDNLSSQLTVTCSPVSGSTFTIGVTTVSCSASDPAGNTASARFNITVLGSAAQLNSLIALTQSMDLQNGISTSLDAKLSAAIATLADMRTNSVSTACSQLAAFVNDTTAQSGNKLTVSQANQLISAAQQIRATLAC